MLAILLTACDSSPAAIKLSTLEGTTTGRGIASLNDGWKFRTGDSQPLTTPGQLDDSWADVVLPHTWNVEDGSDGGDDYYRGDGWYHRQLVVAQELQGRRFYLHFNGANLVTDVYLNGEHVGRHAGGYAAFRFDITPFLLLGESNQLSVKVNNARNDDVPPLAADFTFYGGIYRPLELIVTRDVHIELMDYASPGVYIDQRELSPEQASLDVRSTVVNDGDKSQQLSMHMELLDATGNQVATTSRQFSIAAGDSTAISASLKIKKPHVWQGREDPYLYKMRVSVLSGVTLLDSVTQPVGLRNFTITPDRGAFLNHISVPLHGVSRHQDRKHKGWALSRQDHRQDFQLIADMGANAVRLAHYQHDDYIYQLGDEMGFMIWAEVPVISEVTDSPAFTASARQQLIELIRQNYNHPSIVMWGLFNEISIHRSDANARLVEELQLLAKQENSSRLTTGAGLGDHEDEAVWSITDVVAQNRYDGWYYNSFEGMDAWLNKVRVAYPGRAVGISEYGAGASIDLHSAHPTNQDHTEEYQNLYHEANWLIMRNHPALWGSFIWNMFDFAADLRDEGSISGLNDKGLVSFDRKVKKDSYYWYQSHWRDEPMVYITSRRFDLRKTPTADIKIYSNLPEVELRVNGTSRGELGNDGSNRFLWKAVPLAMGDNAVEALANKASDSVGWKRVLNDDTQLTSNNLGIDNDQHRVFNLPHGLNRAQFGKMLTLPYGAKVVWPEQTTAETLVADDWQFTVVAANEDRQVYSLSRGAISLGKPVTANRELAHGMMGNPPAVARSVVDGNAQIDGESDEDTFWVTADPNQGPGWLKIDLGASYYIEQIDSAWLPAHINNKGTMKYTIDIAGERQESAVVFAESYRQVVDRRNNTQPLRSSDKINAVARYVRVNVLDSSYTYKVPILGTFKLIGATEFSVYGGLIYSDTLAIDYRRHQISLPGVQGADLTVAGLIGQLHMVSENPVYTIWSDTSQLPADKGIKAGDYLLVSYPNDPLLRQERYEFVPISKK